MLAWLTVPVVALCYVLGTPLTRCLVMTPRVPTSPILDANDWAVNGRVRINIPFGTSLTHLAELPPGAPRTLDDPYAEKRTPWKRYVVLALLLAGAAYAIRFDALRHEGCYFWQWREDARARTWRDPAESSRHETSFVETHWGRTERHADVQLHSLGSSASKRALSSAFM